MKAKGHIALGVFVFILILAGLFFDNRLILLMKLNYITLIIGVVLYFVGVVLPDSDIEDGKSRVFYSYAFLFGWFAKLLETPLSLLLKRPTGHQQSLHTLVGITITSISITTLIALIIYFVNLFQLFTAPYIFACLFVGQIVHLLGDLHFELY